jgi:uncharacterized protein YndB with AHSA1/START domain
MTSTNRILGTLRVDNGKGVVHIEDRYDTSIEDLWAAITDPARLARWYGEVKGDLRVGGEFYSHLHAGGWEGTSRIEVCEPPRRLVITGAEPGGPELVDEITLTADGDQAILVIEERGMPLEQVAGWGAGNQIHAEDLAAYLAGGERCDSDARIEELFPAYEALPVEGA